MVGVNKVILIGNLGKNPDVVAFPQDRNDESTNMVKKASFPLATTEYRKNKSKEKSIPAYYIFNNEELDKILELMPKNKQELENAKILSDVKLKLHGDEILKIINK